MSRHNIHKKPYPTDPELREIIKANQGMGHVFGDWEFNPYKGDQCFCLHCGDDLVIGPTCTHGLATRYTCPATPTKDTDGNH